MAEKFDDALMPRGNEEIRKYMEMYTTLVEIIGRFLETQAEIKGVVNILPKIEEMANLMHKVLQNSGIDMSEAGSRLNKKLEEVKSNNEDWLTSSNSIIYENRSIGTKLWAVITAIFILVGSGIFGVYNMKQIEGNIETLSNQNIEIMGVVQNVSDIQNATLTGWKWDDNKKIFYNTTEKGDTLYISDLRLLKDDK